MKHLTLFELHQFIQRVFSVNFEENLWIEAEIAESRVHNGHHYMTLIEKNPAGQLIAKASCSLWRNRAAQLKIKLGSLFPQVIKNGNKVKILCKVEFHPRYGYSLHVVDFDPSYTEGFLFIEKRKTIERLKKEKLFDRNKALDLPLVIQRIAVISSSTAAGYQDFIHQLTENVYGFKYNIELFSSAMQGDNVETQFTTAMSAIEARKKDFDIIVVVRGGGASVDLSDFDNYEVAASVARSSLPVLAGIGHERDISITDMVAFSRVKTPTAAAERLIERNLSFETGIIEIFQNIKETVKKSLDFEDQALNYTDQTIFHTIQSFTDREKLHLERQAFSFRDLVRKNLHKEQMQLQQIQLLITENNPFRIMEKGYAMVIQENRRIRDLELINKSNPFELIMGHKNITINEK